jgi:hypothetical protein
MYCTGNQYEYIFLFILYDSVKLYHTDGLYNILSLNTAHLIMAFAL